MTVIKRPGNESPELVIEPDIALEATQQGIRDAVEALKTTGIVSCPLNPLEIPGITAADALDAGDAIGSIMEIAVPKHGVIISATYWDLDDEGTQLDLEVFNLGITQIASDAVWAPSDIDMLKFVTEIAFFTFDDHINSQTSDVKNIGKAYTATDGMLRIQAVDRSTKNIAAGQMPRIQLQIQSYDPDFQEV